MPPQFYGRFADAFGAEAARDIAQFCNFTLEEIKRVAKAENLDQVSEIRDVTTVTTFEDEERFAEVCRSVRLYEEAVDPKEKFTIIDGKTAEKKYHLKKSAGTLEVKSQVFWPYKLVTGLLKLLLERYPERFSVETKTPVTSITVTEDSDAAYPYVLTTPRGLLERQRFCTA
ncbi:FAD dependent oxidoreductase [Penicillium desertorum]|uniref:FAD dependent oxidoreductase n=1 Tax=Penicillium desertorum TaxID=1303715 RepID=A0A9W9X8R5_9EURO|nr:FAD dependent oxidoreductase [Penicillium desertorum]